MTTRRQGISVTTPTRTITDLRRLLPRDQLNNILREAEAKRLPIGDLAEAELGRSELEVKFLALCRGHHLPEPAVNAQVGQFEVDFLWRDRRVIVETDGYRFHGTRAAFERDRERDARLTLLGFEVVRFSFSQVTSRPQWVASTVEQLLEGRRPEPPVPLPKIGSWPREPPTATNPSSF